MGSSCKQTLRGCGGPHLVTIVLPEFPRWFSCKGSLRFLGQRILEFKESPLTLITYVLCPPCPPDFDLVVTWFQDPGIAWVSSCDWEMSHYIGIMYIVHCTSIILVRVDDWSWNCHSMFLNEISRFMALMAAESINILKGCLKVQSSPGLPPGVISTTRAKRRAFALWWSSTRAPATWIFQPARTGVATIQSGRDFCWFSHTVLRVDQLRTWFSGEGHKPFPKRKVGWPWPI